jgi:hypothetical protein
MAWETVSRYFSGQGVCLAGDTDVDGNPIGLDPLGNVSSLQINIGVSNFEHKESQSGQRGVDKRMQNEIKASMLVNMESFIPGNMAIALRATNQKKTASSVTGEASKVYLGKVMPLKHAKVSTVVIKKGASTLVAYAPGDAPGDWDYMLNADAGSVMWATTVNTVGLVDEDDVTIDYAYAAQSHVQPLTVAAPEKFLRFEGLNTAEENKPVVVEVFRWAPDPLKTLDLINENLAAMNSESSILMDTRRPVGESKFFRVLMVD